MRPSLERGSFSLRLKQLRVGKGFKYARHFASVLGIHENTYTRYERGEVEPNIQTILSICTALGTDPSHLLGFDNLNTPHCPTCTQVASLMKKAS